MVHNTPVLGDRHDFLFTKYSIKIASNGNDYIVHKYDDRGIKHEILDGIEKANILSGRSLKGAIAFTKDTKHSGALHFFLYIAQVIHEFVTGRWKKWNADGIWKKSYASNCHGFIVTGEAIDRHGAAFPLPPNAINEAYHPMMMVDPAFPGVMLYARDNLRDVNVTKCYFYLPRDAALSEQVRDYAIKSAVPKQSSADVDLPVTEWKYYQPGCLTDLSRKIDFSKLNLLTCLSYNGLKLVAKAPCERICRTTALLIADLILSGTPDLKDENEQKRAFFCCSYVTSLFQGALFMRNIKQLAPQALEAFISDEQGRPLNRQSLQLKILTSFSSGDASENLVARIFHNTFHNAKFARVDGEYFSSARFVELADKHSFSKSR